MSQIRYKLGLLWKRRGRTDIVAAPPVGGLGVTPLGTGPLGH